VSITVGSGQSVTFTNQDSAPQTSSSTTSAWDSGTIQPGGSFTLTAPTQPGSYAYMCNIHPFMTGTLIVQ
jgi:plastocyanin